MVKRSANDVALRAGVAVSTVYEALRGTGRISPKTRKRIRAIANELGYRLNRTAAKLQKGRHGAAGIVLRNWQIFPKHNLFAYLDAARRRDLFITIEYVADEVDIPKLISEDCVDGLIVFEEMSPEIRTGIEKLKLPLIEVNTNRRFEPGCLTYDEHDGVRKAFEIFHGAGRQHPAFFCTEPGNGRSMHYSQTARREAVLQFADEFAMADPVMATAFESKNGNSMMHVLDANPQVDCVLLYSDALAGQLYDAALRLGRSVPEDLSVIGFNNSIKATGVYPRLTSVAVPATALADASLDMLEHVIQQGSLPPHRVLPFEVTVREST